MIWLLDNSKTLEKVTTMCLQGLHQLKPHIWLGLRTKLMTRSANRRDKRMAVMGVWIGLGCLLELLGSIWSKVSLGHENE